MRRQRHTRSTAGCNHPSYGRVPTSTHPSRDSSRSIAARTAPGSSAAASASSPKPAAPAASAFAAAALSASRVFASLGKM